MKVPLVDLRPQHDSLRDQLLAAVERVIDKQQFVLGPEVQILEEEIAKYSETSFAVGCASGSDALLLALMALDIGSGDEVITTPFTFFATGSAIVRLGARPVLVDIDPNTYNLDTSRLAAAITSRTRAIIPVHLYGQCTDMASLEAISEQHHLPIVEDAAQAIGAEDRGRRAGSMGAIGCFSFYPSKNLGGAGDGGMLTTNNKNLADRLRRLRAHGGTNEYHHSEVGINSRLDSLQAAVLRVKLKFLDRWSAARRNKASRYSDLLLETSVLEFEVIPPFVRPEARHVFHQYVVRISRYRDAMMKHLLDQGVGTKVYYPVPLHLQQCFSNLGYHEGDFPESERAARETFALPIYPELTDQQQSYVIETLRSFRPDPLATH